MNSVCRRCAHLRALLPAQRIHSLKALDRLPHTTQGKQKLDPGIVLAVWYLINPLYVPKADAWLSRVRGGVRGGFGALHDKAHFEGYVLPEKKMQEMMDYFERTEPGVVVMHMLEQKPGVCVHVASARRARRGVGEPVLVLNGGCM